MTYHNVYQPGARRRGGSACEGGRCHSARAALVGGEVLSAEAVGGAAPRNHEDYSGLVSGGITVKSLQPGDAPGMFDGAFSRVFRMRRRKVWRARE